MPLMQSQNKNGNITIIYEAMNAEGLQMFKCRTSRQVRALKPCQHHYAVRK